MDVDFFGVIHGALELAGVVVTVFGGVALQAIARKFKTDASAQQVAAFDGALGKALQFGVTASEDLIRAKGWDHVDVKSQVVGIALNTMVARFPGALAAVGLSANLGDPANQKAIQDALQRALPAAFTVAAASPATPPAPSLAVHAT